MTDQNTTAGEAEVLMELGVSPIRRIFALAVLLLLGLLLIWNGMVLPGAVIGLKLILMLMGAAVLWLGIKMYDRTRGGLILTKEALSDYRGTCLIRMEDVVAMEKGVFALKPSNGFMLRGTGAPGNLWAPGMYWRVGKRVGVGGITNARDAKSMIEIIVALTETHS